MAAIAGDDKQLSVPNVQLVACNTDLTVCPLEKPRHDFLDTSHNASQPQEIREVSTSKSPTSVSFDLGVHSKQTVDSIINESGTFKRDPSLTKNVALNFDQVQQIFDTRNVVKSSTAIPSCLFTARESAKINASSDLTMESFSAKPVKENELTPVSFKNKANDETFRSYTSNEIEKRKVSLHEGTYIDKFSDLNINENRDSSVDGNIRSNYGEFTQHNISSKTNESFNFLHTKNFSSIKGSEQGDLEGTKHSANSRTLSENTRTGNKESSLIVESDAVYDTLEGVNPTVVSKLKSEVKSEFLASEFTARRRSIDEIMAEYGIVTDRLCTKSSDFVYGREQTKEQYPDIKVVMPGTMQNDGEAGHAKEEMQSKYYSGTKFKDSSNMSSLVSEDRVPYTSKISLINSSQNNDADSDKNQDTKQSCGKSVDETKANKETNAPIESLIKTSSYARDLTRTFNCSADAGSKFLATLSSETQRYLSGSYGSYDGGTKSCEASSTGDYNKVQSERKDVSFTTGGNFEFIKSLGSSSEALGYSLNQERQRLRKLDNMIMTTPVHVTPVSKSANTRYLAQGYGHAYGSSELSSRRLADVSRYTSSSLGYGGDMWDKPSIPETPTFRPTESSISKGVKSSIDVRNNTSSNGSRPSTKASYDAAVVQRLLDEEREAKARRWAHIDGKQDKGNNKQQKRKGVPKSGVAPPQRSVQSCFISGNQQGKSFSERNLTAVKSRSKASTNKNKQRGAASNAPKNPQSSQSCVEEDFRGFDFVKQLNKIWSQSILGEKIDIKATAEKEPKYRPYKSATQREGRSKAERNSSPVQPKSLPLFPNEYEVSPQTAASEWAFRRHTPNSNRYDPKHSYYTDSVDSGSSIDMSYGSVTNSTRHYRPPEPTMATKSKKKLKQPRPQSTRSCVGAVPKSILKQASSTKVNKPRPSSSYAPSASKSTLKKKNCR